MTKTQKILLVSAGALGMLWLLSRTASASTTTTRRLSAGPGEVVTSTGGGSQTTSSAPDVPAPPSGPPAYTVMFDNASASISGPRLEALQTWISRQEGMVKNLTGFELHGYSSRSGSEATNLRYSRQRVEFVTRQLAMGTALPVTGYSHGEIHDIPDDQARRVDIYTIGGSR